MSSAAPPSPLVALPAHPLPHSSIPHPQGDGIIPLLVAPWDTTDSTKRNIQAMTGIPAFHQRLVFKPAFSYNLYNLHPQIPSFMVEDLSLLSDGDTLLVLADPNGGMRIHVKRITVRSVLCVTFWHGRRPASLPWCY